MDNKHYIIDTCLANDGLYEICIMKEIKGLDLADRVETLRVFKKKSLQLMENIANVIILDILSEFGIKPREESDKETICVLNALKRKTGKTLKIFPYRLPKGCEEIACVGNTEKGHDICISDDIIYIVEKVGLCEVEKGLN